MKNTIIYLHGFNSTNANNEKALKLKRISSEYNVVVPLLSPNPLEAIHQIDDIITENIFDSHITIIGTSLGGFYALYESLRHDIPCVCINPAIDPHQSLINKVGVYTRYGSGEVYDFKEIYVKYLLDMRLQMNKFDVRGCNLNFFLANDDEILDHSNIKNLYKTANNINYFDNQSHRFLNFDVIIPDIKKIIENHIFIDDDCCLDFMED